MTRISLCIVVLPLISTLLSFETLLLYAVDSAIYMPITETFSDNHKDRKADMEPKISGFIGKSPDSFFIKGVFLNLFAT